MIPIRRAALWFTSESSRIESTRSLCARSRMRPTFDPCSSSWFPTHLVGTTRAVGGRHAQGLLRVRERDEHQPRVHELAQVARDHGQQRLELELGGERVADLVDRLELAEPARRRLVQARVLDRYRCLRGEEPDELLVLLGEVLVVPLLREIEVPVRHAAEENGDAEEGVHGRMVRRQADRAGVVGDVVETDRSCFADDDAEETEAPRDFTDGGVRLRVDPGRQEPLQPVPGGMDDPERRVARARQLGGGVDDPLQERRRARARRRRRCRPRRGRAGGRSARRTGSSVRVSVRDPKAPLPTVEWRSPALAGLLRSRPVSRILSWMTICLCGAPGPSAGHVSGTCFALHRTGFGKPTVSPRPLVGSYPTFSPLPTSVARGRRSPFCSTFRRLSPPGSPQRPCPAVSGLSSSPRGDPRSPGLRSAF